MYVDVEDKEVNHQSYADFVTKQQVSFRKAFALARKSLSAMAERRKKRYDMRVRPKDYAVCEWVYYFCPRQRIGLSPKWQKFYSRPFMIVAILEPVNLRIQKTTRSGALVVHVDKIERYNGVAPDSWLPDGLGQDALGAFSGENLNWLFLNDPPVRTADIVNDETVATPVKRPARNAPVPASYLSHILAVSVVSPVQRVDEFFG